MPFSGRVRVGRESVGELTPIFKRMSDHVKFHCS